MEGQNAPIAVDNIPEINRHKLFGLSGVDAIALPIAWVWVLTVLEEVPILPPLPDNFELLTVAEVGSVGATALPFVWIWVLTVLEEVSILLLLPGSDRGGPVVLMEATTAVAATVLPAA